MPGDSLTRNEVHVTFEIFIDRGIEGPNLGRFQLRTVSLVAGGGVVPQTAIDFSREADIAAKQIVDHFYAMTTQVLNYEANVT